MKFLYLVTFITVVSLLTLQSLAGVIILQFDEDVSPEIEGNGVYKESVSLECLY